MGDHSGSDLAYNDVCEDEDDENDSEEDEDDDREHGNVYPHLCRSLIIKYIFNKGYRSAHYGAHVVASTPAIKQFVLAPPRF